MPLRLRFHDCKQEIKIFDTILDYSDLGTAIGGSAKSRFFDQSFSQIYRSNIAQLQE